MPASQRTMSNPDHTGVPGRGSANRQSGRFESIQHVVDADSVNDPEFIDQLSQKVPTEYLEDNSQSIVSENQSPDIPFRYSLNPYRGCAHGCSYCYARPTHEYLGLGAGLDFESKIFVKRQAPQLFRDWLVEGAKKGRAVKPVMLSGVTDPYQPIERDLELTRGCLRVAAQFNQPMQVITKNHMICRDLDLFGEMAKSQLVHVAISITSLDQSLTRIMEPRTSSPSARLDAVRELSQAGVPVMVMIAPIVPSLNDSEIPSIMEAVAEAGASRIGYVMLRLPLTVETVFLEWLEQHFPDRKEKIIARVRSIRDGRLNSSVFGERMSGKGIWAEQIQNLVATFAQRYGLTFGVNYEASRKEFPLRTDLFRVVQQDGNVHANSLDWILVVGSVFKSWSAAAFLADFSFLFPAVGALVHNAPDASRPFEKCVSE